MIWIVLLAALVVAMSACVTSNQARAGECKRVLRPADAIACVRPVPPSEPAINAPHASPERADDAFMVATVPIPAKCPVTGGPYLPSARMRVLSAPAPGGARTLSR